jgi:hypothetical protein
MKQTKTMTDRLFDFLMQRSFHPVVRQMTSHLLSDKAQLPAELARRLVLKWRCLVCMRVVLGQTFAGLFSDRFVRCTPGRVNMTLQAFGNGTLSIQTVQISARRGL